jgi:hypothetical protein
MPRYWPLLAIAAVPQVGCLYGIWLPGMFLVSVAAFWLLCLWNRDIPGVLFVGLGVMLNFLAMAFHEGAMPVHLDVLLQAGYVAPPGATLLGSKDIVVHASPLGLLSDWIVLSLGERTLIVSPGDMLAVFGILYWLLSSYWSKERVYNAAISRYPSAA